MCPIWGSTPRKQTFFVLNTQIKTNMQSSFDVNDTVLLTKLTIIWPTIRPKRSIKLSFWSYERMKIDCRRCLNNAPKMPSAVFNLAVTTKWASTVCVWWRCCTLCYLVHARDIFFKHVGKDSKLAREIDILTMLHGRLHCRQSNREWPNTRFPSGIRAGKQDGKKHTGIILGLLTAICSGKGQKLLETRPKCRESGVIKDWIMLLETLLDWEAWLTSPKMMKPDVQKAKTEHRYIMCSTQKVAVRQTAMGLKLIKFHGVFHMTDDVHNFSVPLEYDTGCNKNHQIPAKKTSMLTQKDLTKVEDHVAERMLEMEVLALVQMEIGGKWVCDYWVGHADNVEDAKLPERTGQATIRI